MWFFLALAMPSGTERFDRMSDQELAEQFQKEKDTRFLLALIKRYQAAMVARYRRFAHDEMSAQEVVQELLVLLYDRLLKMKKIDKPRGAMFTVINHHLIDLDRRWKTEQKWKAHAQAGQAEQERLAVWSRQGLGKQLERQDFREKAMAKLTETERNCLELYVLSYSHREISKKLEVTQNQVRGAIYRAVKRLRESPDLKHFSD